MKNAHIVLIDHDIHNDARHICENMFKEKFDDLKAVDEYLKKVLDKEDVMYLDGIMVLDLDQFMDESNDQMIDLEQYFISFITITID